MNNPLDRPEGMSDKDYIKQLEDFVLPIIRQKSKLKSYLGISNFIETNSDYLSEIKLEIEVPDGFDMSKPEDVQTVVAMSDKIADFKDKSMTNMLKFAGDLLKYNETRDVLREQLVTDGVDIDAAEKKFLKGGEGFSVEEFV